MSIPTPRYDEALLFLEQYFGDEPALLTAVNPIEFKTSSVKLRPVTDAAKIRRWMESITGIMNIYFMVNAVKGEVAGAKKALKVDVSSVTALHVDIDPRVGEDITGEKPWALAKLAAYPRKPTWIIDSGNGIQAFWKLKTPFEVNGDIGLAEMAEGYNRGLALEFNGDNCHNVDRIMRIPGTVNVPNVKKAKAGRVPVLAAPIEYNPDSLYEINEFPSFGAPPPKILGGTSTAVSTVVVSAPLKDIPQHLELESFPNVTDYLKTVITHGLDPKRPDRWGSRSDIVFWAVHQLFAAGLSDEFVISILLDASYRISESVLEKKSPRDYAIRQTRRVKQRTGFSDKPVIEIKKGAADAAVDAAEQAMMSMGIEVFRYYNTIMRVVNNGADQPLSLHPVEAHWLLEKFGIAAKWVKRSGKETVAAEPAMTHAMAYLQRHGEWKVPRLKAIIMTPTLREDFSVLAESGYDVASGLYYEPGSVRFPQVPEHPTREDAEDGLAMLVRPLRAFPFVPDKLTDDWIPDDNEGLKPSAARSVMLSAMLSGVIRPMLGPVPLHAIDAADKGSGKSILADCIAIMLTGVPARMMSLGDDSDEDRKRLFSVLLSSPIAVCFDNVERKIEGDALCTILTQETWQERTLGKSEMGIVSTKALFMATGNNIEFYGDMTRRAVICKLDARCERPDLRRFSFDPRDEVKASRPDLVVAALTILRAYVLAGRPVEGKIPPMGSFEGWGLVREALVWLGQPDPIATRAHIIADDPQQAMIWDMMEAWERCYAGTRQKLMVVVAGLHGQSLDEYQSKLRDASVSACPGGKVTLRMLRWWFKRYAGKVINGRRFIREEDPDTGTVICLAGAEGTPEPVWEG